MIAAIIRSSIDGSVSLSIVAETDSEATLVDVLLADWRGRRQYVSSYGGPVDEHRTRLTIRALPIEDE